MHGEAQPPTQHTRLPSAEFRSAAGWKYQPIMKTFMFEHIDATSEHAPSQPRWRRRYNASPVMDSDSEVKQRREHRTKETRQKRRSTTDDRTVNTMRRLLDHKVQSDSVSLSGLSGSSKKVSQRCIEDPPPRASSTKQRRPYYEPICSSSDSESSSYDAEGARHRTQTSP